MARRWTNDLTRADVTPKAAWLNRRQLMVGAGAIGLASIGGGAALASLGAKPSDLSTDEPLTSLEDVTSYNNFYEFGTGKDDPAKYASALTTEPWSVTIDGLVDKPGDYSMDQILEGVELEERIYRFRCVEAWAMVVPWVGFELKDLLDKVGVKPEAKYVAFETLYRPEEMWAQSRPILEWPYREGLRLDEAMHPLTILATGLYDEPMPKQNGAPIRLVVPWKYGYKSIKSIVKITLTDEEPPISWNMANPREYGFYSNVNPEVDHPRWSQATHRMIGGGLFAKRVPTLMLNGYEAEVASLYSEKPLNDYF
jgi:sulfoxide reductase catalytic subunit YedY